MITKHYDDSVELLFDEEKHIYLIGRDRVPGVTGILGELAKPGLVYWAGNCARDYVKENLKLGHEYDEIDRDELANRAGRAHRAAINRAAGIGTLTHNFAENYINARMLDTEEPFLPRNKVAARCSKQFLDWYEGHDIQPIATEFRCLSMKHWFAGTSDLDCMMDGKRTMVDFKTSKGIYPEMGYQLAAYCKARKEELGIHYDQRVIACFPKEGATFETQSFEDFDNDWKVFRAARDVYKVKKESTWKRRGAA